MENRYQTIRQVARLSRFPNEHTIRAWVKRGIVPGYYAQTRYYIDVVKFAEALDQMAERGAAAPRREEVEI